MKWSWPVALRVATVVTLIAGVAGGADAQDTRYKKKRPGPLTLLPADELARGGQPFVIGGKEVLPGDFPASFYQKSSDGNCTATLVGPRTLLTAAHCVGNGKDVSVKVAGNTIKGTCDHHTAYKDDTGDVSADFALCLLADRISGRQPETVNLIAPSDLKVNSTVLLVGYGCTKPDMTGADGVLRAGLATVKDMPKGTGVEPFYLLSSNSNPETPAVVCPGDSGGAVYWLRDRTNVAGSRRVVAVNSQVGVTPANIVNGTSYLSATFVIDFKTFASQWAADKRAEICGVTPNVSVACKR